MFGKAWRRATGAAFASAVVVLSAALPGAAGANAVPVRPGPSSLPGGSRGAAAVPWKSVGTGWVLAEDASAKNGPATLYLVSPSGRKYALRAPGGLIAWSAGKTQALFELSQENKLEQLNLQTGKASKFGLPLGTYALGYAQPAGRQVLAVTQKGLTSTLATYNLSGQLVTTLGTAKYGADGIGAANGSAFAVASSSGLRLVSSSGRLLKNLTVPAAVGCEPVRWWTAGEVLATCTTKSGGSYDEHLYLVPANGARPAELTPFRTSSYDLGDFDAWRLPSGLYLQSFGACGTLEINKLAANGSITPVTVPGTASPSYEVITADGPRLLIETEGCTARGQLLWLNPATRAETWLFKSGTIQVVPFADSRDPLVPI
jgi:TolB protein